MAHKINSEEAAKYGNTKHGHTRPMLISEENAIIQQALLILERRLKKKGPSLTSPNETKAYITAHLQQKEHECFCAMFLDNKHRMIEWEEMFTGTVNSASVYPREVVKAALKHNACAVIFVHNHPSGDPEPSAADVSITKRLKDALALVDVTVLDHLIVGESIVVFSERGLI